VPQIIKIKKCLLKLQLKMSGVFFIETQCIYLGYKFIDNVHQVD